MDLRIPIINVDLTDQSPLSSRSSNFLFSMSRYLFIVIKLS